MNVSVLLKGVILTAAAFQAEGRILRAVSTHLISTTPDPSPG